ncbi:MAG: metal ABC transporter ATP-binding protein [Thermodesulfovibrionales bacterium]|nr:metal ABC transporter ATP-binding protein [Thermodesulfovibrionales bacterium]
MNAVEIKGLYYSIGSKDILKDIDLVLEEGRFLGIVGPNGGGKTTLLKIILGILKPSSGTVKVEGGTPLEAIKRGLFGYLPQALKIDLNFPARAIDVVLTGLYGKIGYIRFPSKEHREKALEVLRVMGMEGLAFETFGNLSAGQQQRVLAARALVAGPKILILDEPSTGIDVVGQEDFYHLLKGLQRKLNITIIMVSHDIGALSGYVDEVACLNRILHYHGSPVNALSDEVLSKLYGRSVDIMLHSEACERCERLKRGYV